MITAGQLRLLKVPYPPAFGLAAPAGLAVAAGLATEAGLAAAPRLATAALTELELVL